MFGLGLIIIVLVAAIVGGFYFWSRQRRPGATEGTAERPIGKRRISLLTEAVAYVGAILLLAGGATAIGQRWDDISRWGHVGIFAGVAAFFLLVGVVVRQVTEPAIQRLVGVVWFLSVAGVAWAVGLATLDADGNTRRSTFLVVGVAVTLYSAALWLLRHRALQNFALFVGLIVAISGTIVTIADPAPPLAFALALWGFGLVWAGLGWRQYIEPIWVTMPSGALLALVAPSVAISDHGWVYAIGIATAAAAMASTLALRNTPLLALGALAMFGYVTSAVVQYFGDSLGVPAALAITGALIICLAVVTARLMRVTRQPEATETVAQQPPQATPSLKSHEPALSGHRLGTFTKRHS
jgi:hypothetical protein